MDSSWVDGYCPMGCGRTLFLSLPNKAGRGGVTCSLIGCPRPTAVDELLADRETEHIAVLDEDGHSIQHPLRERLDGELFRCELFTWLGELSGPPRELGRYRVRGPFLPDKVSESRGFERWTFERLGNE